MTFGEKEKLSSLTHDMGFQTLCKIFEDHINFLEQNMRKAQDPLQTLRFVREWQVFRKFTDILRNEPAQAAAEVEKERAMLPPEVAFAQHYGHAIFDNMINENDNIE